jgi:hypothetical protein
MKKQTLKDWEWVIIDDSPNEDNDKHFTFLRDLFKNDAKIRLYRKAFHSGNIGNVKNEAVSLCRGKYLLELDHDDEIVENLFENATRAFTEDDEIGFVYTDFINIYENGSNFHYGDFFGKGYAGYYRQKYNGKWVYVCITPNINNVTMSHLVGMPNHPRIWKRSVLMNILGNYNEYLYICDDLELLLKTSIMTKIVKIAQLGYIQYMNDGGNNFSYIRNTEINRLGPYYLVPTFNNQFKFHEKMEILGGNDNSHYIHNCKNIWERNDYDETKIINKIINYDYTMQYCILGIKVFLENIDEISMLYNNHKNDFILVDHSIDNESTILLSFLEEKGFDRMKCVGIKDAINESYLINYFMRLYKSCDNYRIFNENYQLLHYILPFNTQYNYRHDIINLLYNDDKKSYLEIGVEYGITFQNVKYLHKIGVDPDPKFESPYLIRKTSDHFFDTNCNNNDNNKNDKHFDIIFIDGMHQSEYFLRDFINSVRSLNVGGIIYVDDILPINYREQKKIPIKHYYENNILKYGEPWTGDIWKVVYYILKRYRYKELFKFHYYNNAMYRGVGQFIINDANKMFENYDFDDDTIINEINNYDYWSDFPYYIELITEWNAIFA